MVPIGLVVIAGAAAAAYYLFKSKPVAPVPGGGVAPVTPNPPPQTPVVPVPGGGVLPVTPAAQSASWRTMSISEFVAASNDPRAKPLTDDTPNTVDLQKGSHYVLIVTQDPNAPAGHWFGVPATVTSTAPSATMTVDVQIPGGPPAGTAFEIGATDAFLDPQALSTGPFLADHGESGIPGVSYA